MNNKVNGVHAFESEEYVLPIKFEMERQTAERSWWAHPFVIVFLTLLHLQTLRIHANIHQSKL